MAKRKREREHEIEVRSGRHPPMSGELRTLMRVLDPPPAADAPTLTDEDRKAIQEFLNDWHAQELAFITG